MAKGGGGLQTCDVDPYVAAVRARAVGQVYPILSLVHERMSS